MPVCSGRVLVGALAVFVSRSRVRLGFVMLALRMMMGRLKVMVGRGMMRGGGIVMMFMGRMLCGLSHGESPKTLIQMPRREF